MIDDRTPSIVEEIKMLSGIRDVDLGKIDQDLPTNLIWDLKLARIVSTSIDNIKLLRRDNLTSFAAIMYACIGISST